MNNFSRNRWLSIAKDGLTVVLIAVGIFLVSDLLIRLLWSKAIFSTGGSGVTIRDKDLGHVLKPNSTQVHQGPEYSYLIKINSDGLRDESEHEIPKPPGRIRILLLGDSFTFGHGNPYEDTWPVLVENTLRREGFNVDLVKAGVWAYGVREEFLYMKRLVPKYQPYIVVFALLPHGFRSALPFDLHEANTASRVEVPEPEVGARAWLLLNRLHLFLFFKSFLHRYDSLVVLHRQWYNPAGYCKEPASDFCDQQSRIVSQYLERAKQYCTENRAELVVLLIPQATEVILGANEDIGGNYDINFIDRRVSATAFKNGFHLINAYPAMVQCYKREQERLYYPLDGHFNKRGNECLGRFFSRQLVERLPSFFSGFQPDPADSGTGKKP